MLDDLTLREVFHFRVSLLGAISVITLSIIGLILLLSVLIVYTMLHNGLPFVIVGFPVPILQAYCLFLLYIIPC